MLRVILTSSGIIYSHSIHIDEVPIKRLPGEGKEYKIVQMTLNGPELVGTFKAEKIKNWIKVGEFYFKKYKRGTLIKYGKQYIWYANGQKIVAETKKQLDEAIEKYKNISGHYDEIDTIITTKTLQKIDRIITSIKNEPVFTWEIKNGMITITIDGIDIPILEAPKPPVEVKKVEFSKYGLIIILLKTPSGNVLINFLRSGGVEVITKKKKYWFYPEDREYFNAFYQVFQNMGDVEKAMMFLEV